jgi:hypothetical protein
MEQRSSQKINIKEEKGKEHAREKQKLITNDTDVGCALTRKIGRWK